MKKGTLWPAKVAERGFHHTSGGRESCHVVPLVVFVGWTTINQPMNLDDLVGSTNSDM